MKQKLAIIVLLVWTLFAFTHCGVKSSLDEKSALTFGHIDGPTSSSITNSAQLKTSFSNTVWPITTKRCASCHGDSQQPLHASSDLSTAFDAAVTANKINTSDPSKSRLVLKLRDERHNCWSDCDDNADELEDAIATYVSEVAKILENDSNSSTVADGDSNSSLETNEVGPLVNLVSSEYLEYFTADQFSLQTPFVLSGENGDQYFTTSTNTGVLRSNSSASAGRAYVNFRTLLSKEFNFWAQVNAPTGSDNSFHVRVDDGNYVEWHIEETNGFEWRKVTSTANMDSVKFSIAAGLMSTIEFRQREDGVSLKAFYLTDDDAFIPGSGGFDSNAEATYDISSLLDLSPNSILFKMSIRSFDEYSYQVSNLRIETDRRIRIVAPKILVNGIYTAQHNTFNYVDETIEVGESVIASYSMLVLKEDGDEADTFSWSFDSLELR